MPNALQHDYVTENNDWNVDVEVIHERGVLPVDEIGQILEFDLANQVRHPHEQIDGHAQEDDGRNRNVQTESEGISPLLQAAAAPITLKPDSGDDQERNAESHYAVP